jgi:hypothetical protein
MATGPGRYDDLATLVREKSSAQGVLVAVIGGDKGMGFSVQATPETLLVLPELLEQIARQIRRDLEGE